MCVCVCVCVVVYTNVYVYVQMDYDDQFFSKLNLLCGWVTASATSKTGSTQASNSLFITEVRGR